MLTIFAVYRATFPMTFKEIRAGYGDYKTVIPAVTVMILFAAWIYYFLRKTGTLVLSDFLV